MEIGASEDDDGNDACGDSGNGVVCIGARRRSRLCGCVAVNATLDMVLDVGGACFAFGARLVVVVTSEPARSIPASPRRVRRPVGRST
ncbi:MAG: hypothetical protein HY905_02415 [Deltaproteobacteria bacterium]|nr:hypothetical protein [Deltaproteobacteria bacterium]